MPKINQFPGTTTLATTDVMVTETSTGTNTRKIAYSDFRTQIQNELKSVFALKGEIVTDEQVATAVTEWLDENVDPVGSAVVVDSSLSISGAAADAKATGDGLIDLKNASNEIINIVPPRLRNSGAANGVTLTVNDDGTYTISGTCTADVRFDLWSDGSNLPSWLSYNRRYFTMIYGRVNIDIWLTSMSGSSIASKLAVNPDVLTPIDIPGSGGFRISIICASGVTYSETVRVVMIQNTQTINGAYCGITSEETLKKIANLLPEIDSVSANGLTLTNNGDGSYTLTGTSTQDTNITFFTSASDIPAWMDREEEYYALLQGVVSPSFRLIVTTRPGYAFLAKARENPQEFISPTSNGMMIALNVDGGVTFNEKITPVVIKKSYFTEIYLPKPEIIVATDGSGDFSKIKDAIEYANQHRGTTIRILAGSYNLVTEYGDAYLDGLSDNNPDYGMYLGNDVKIICSPDAEIYFDYDGTNEWVVRYFSPFNTSNYLGYEVIGMRIIAHNCRYIVHDDPLWGTKENFSHNIWRDCYFEIFSSPQVTSWPNHQAVGGGFGTNSVIEFDSCIFNCHYSNVSQYSALSYHNDVSGSASAKSRLTVKNCYFSAGNRLVIEGYGASTEKSEVMICGNSFGNASTDIIYDSSSSDNITVYRFNNQSR